MLFDEKFNIDTIINYYNINRFMLIKCRLPYSLLINMDVFMINYNLKIGETLNENRRKIVYAVTKNCYQNQSIPSKNELFSYNPVENTYSFFGTEIDIIVEYLRDEQDLVDDLISGQSDGNNSNEASAFIQSCLEIFALKYNESNGGNDFYIPYVEELGCIHIFSYNRTSEKNIFITNNGRIKPSCKLIDKRNHEIDNLHISMQKEDVSVWKYFFNKAKHSYYVNDNFDCVLSTAISMESYLVYLIKEKQMSDDFEKVRKKCERERKKSSGFYFKLNYLFNNNIINKNDKKVLKDTYSLVDKYRNSIVHGDIENPLQERYKAKTAFNSIIKAYELLEGIDSNIQEKYYQTMENEIINSENESKKVYDLLNKGLWNEALELCQIHLDKGIYLNVATFHCAICYEKIGEYDNAILYFSECIENGFNLFESFLHRSTCYYSINKYEEALINIDKSLEIIPKSEVALLTKMTILANNNKNLEALNIISLIIESNNNDSKLFYNKAVILHKCEMYDLAIENYTKAIELSPEKSEYHSNRGIAYINVKEFNKAKNDLKEAIKIDNQNQSAIDELKLLLDSEVLTK